jgi:hypothetical protein
MKKFFAIVGAFIILIIPHQCFASNYSISIGYGAQLYESGEHLIILKGGYEIKLIKDRKTGFIFLLEPSLIEFNERQIGIAAGTVFENQFMLSDKITLFVSWGAGVLLTNKELTGEGNIFNFMPQGGLGASYIIGGKKSILGELRYWHASNSGIANPNRGIDDLVVFLGTKF